jgi:hypothetical protein
MHSESRWRRFSVLVPVLIVALVVLMALTGRFLPKPFGSHNPMDTVALRVAEVWQHAVGRDTPCIMVLGDSRVAFQINATQLAIGACTAQNFGFAAMGIGILRLAREVAEKGPRPRVVVFGVTEQITFVSGPTYAREGRYSLESLKTVPTFWTRISGSRYVLAAHLNLLRYSSLFRYAQGAAPPLNSGWIWIEELGRWTAGFDSIPPLDTSPIRAALFDEIGQSYFEGRRAPVDLDEMLQEVVVNLKAIGDTVVLFIPPQHPDFQPIAEARAPGQQRLMRESVARVARSTGAIVLDCLAPEACGVERSEFADPVHLRTPGAEVLTKELAKTVAAVLSAR